MLDDESIYIHSCDVCTCVDALRHFLYARDACQFLYFRVLPLVLVFLFFFLRLLQLEKVA